MVVVNVRRNLGTRKRASQRFWTRLIVFAVVSGAVHNAVAQESVEVSPDITTRIGSTVVTDAGVVDQIEVLTAVGNLPATADLDGFHRSPAGDLLFSVDATAGLGDLVARRGDVVSFDGAGYDLALDSAGAGLAVGVDVDAVSEAGGQLLVSFDTTVTIGGTVFADEDLALYHGSGFSLFLDGSAAGVPEQLDLDAAHALDNGRVLMSFDTGGNVSGLPFSSADVLEYDPASGGWSIAFRASSLAGWGSADVDALSAFGDKDNDGLADNLDNCSLVPNIDQRDTNIDNIGNVCDADINDDCAVNFGDLAVLKAAFFPRPYVPDADFDGDGFVNFGDLARLKQTFFNGPEPGPGPSGLPNDCNQ